MCRHAIEPDEIAPPWAPLKYPPKYAHTWNDRGTPGTLPNHSIYSQRQMQKTALVWREGLLASKKARIPPGLTGRPLTLGFGSFTRPEGAPPSSQEPVS